MINPDIRKFLVLKVSKSVSRCSSNFLDHKQPFSATLATSVGSICDFAVLVSNLYRKPANPHFLRMAGASNLQSQPVSLFRMSPDFVGGFEICFFRWKPGGRHQISNLSILQGYWCEHFAQKMSKSADFLLSDHMESLW